MQTGVSIWKSVSVILCGKVDKRTGDLALGSFEIRMISLGMFAIPHISKWVYSRGITCRSGVNWRIVKLNGFIIINMIVNNNKNK